MSRTQGASATLPSGPDEALKLTNRRFGAQPLSDYLVLNALQHRVGVETGRKMAFQIGSGDRVRVIALTGAAVDHLVVVTAERPPLVGDVGTVVDVADRLGGIGRHYTVACGRVGGRPVWLATFAEHELELVAAR